ncbi:MAG: type I-E CRISPR-associated protein Cas6/Cse3/CasE [Candidatus Methanomethylophilaceae archaeon]|nr:type I-E CRISPR-associated protein Cas6/Cse3/CasE [Candidatus Methanomethylophilaceae archaeon]
MLKVTDADRFRESMVNGIGRAKAYGCGMLTVAKS